MQQFCPKCGKEVDTLLGPRGLCSECFSESHDLVELPDEIQFRQCSVCNGYMVGGAWKDFKDDQTLVYDLLKPYEKDTVEMGVSFRKQGEKYIANVLMEDFIDGEHIQQTVTVELIPEKTQCPTCSRFHGGYYEAILQLRGNITEDMFGQLMDHAAHVTNQDRNNFIAEVEEQDGGYDIYTSTTTMAEKILDHVKEQFQVDVTKSRELVGEKDGGKKVYKLVISAQIGRQLH